MGSLYFTLQVFVVKSSTVSKPAGVTTCQDALNNAGVEQSEVSRAETGAQFAETVFPLQQLQCAPVGSSVITKDVEAVDLIYCGSVKSE